MNRANKKLDNKENIPEFQNQCGNFDPRSLKDTVTTNDIKNELSKDGSDSENFHSQEDLEKMYSTELQLYADHEVKPDIVIGPVVLQRPVFNNWDYPNELLGSTQIHEQVRVKLEVQKRIESELQIKHYPENYSEFNELKKEQHDFTEENYVVKSVQINDETKATIVSDSNATESVNSYDDKEDHLSYPKPRRNSKTSKNVKPKKQSKSRKTPKPRKTYTSRKRKGKCPHCDKYFISLGNHLLIHKTNSYTCKSCDETFHNKLDYNQHMTQKHRKIYVCDYCKKSLRSREGLIIHLRNHTTNSKEVRRLKESKLEVKLYCNFCEKSFTIKNNLSRHIKTKHGKRETFSCQFCCKIFTCKRYLQDHEQRHPPKKGERKKYECSMCDKLYYDASNRNRHVNVQHLGKKYFRSTRPELICDCCKQSFQRKQDLVVHINQNHMGNKFKKYYKCKLCTKQYSRIHNLNIHMRKHMGQKPFMCQMCGKKFDRRYSLQKHITKMCSTSS